MAGEKMMRIGQVASKLNIGRSTIIEFLAEKGHEIDRNPNAKINGEQYDLLAREFADSAHDKEEASGLTIGTKHSDDVVIKATSSSASKKEDEEEILIKGFAQNVETTEEETTTPEPAEEEVAAVESPKLQGIKVVGKIDLDKKKEEPEPTAEVEEPAEVEEEVVETPQAEEPAKEVKSEETTAPDTPAEAETKETEGEAQGPVIEAKADSLKGLTVLGKIELPQEKPKKAKPVASSDDEKDKKKKRPRKRIRVENDRRQGGGGKRQDNRPQKEEPSDKEIQEKIKATLAKLSGTKPSAAGNRSKYRKEKRSTRAEANEEKMLQEQEDSKVLKVTEFIAANDLASLMNVSVNEVIATCMSLGMFVSINQRLDAESITIIADEFGFDVQFSSAEDEADVVEVEDAPEDLKQRAPIVTIMGHVDHGKTSLLDYIREANVTEGEAGGITQHIGAYDVNTTTGKRVAFLDTPGHEAFTAMRARGAQITDVVIIVVAADDSVMPQTKEAINHAMVAEVPIVIAINKVDKPNANPDKIKEDLANNNILVEDWGGKYQCQEVSAKTGQGVDDLLEKVILEAELLDLKANPDKPAVGNVIEAELDKGRGYVTTIMVQTGTLR
ncbi:MAG: translation initiation factor IF-2 N-terminal domain-containing protein, partial [Bacteroidota bacterium]